MRKKEYEKYISPFKLNEVDIIQYNGTDVGRLSIVKTKEHIYIGGFRILPEFQNKRIKTAILLDLIEESKILNRSILLEVQKVNL